jgi:hypothetical protein
VLVLWIAAAAAPWWSDVLEARVGAALPGADSTVLGPGWMDAPARRAARRALFEDPGEDLGAIEAQLEQSLRARPLYAPTWLARAELELRRGEPEAAGRFATVATSLWPHRRRLVWRVAALRAELGDRGGTLRALGRYLTLPGADAVRAAWVAERLEPETGRWLAELLPPGSRETGAIDADLWRLLHRAARQGDAAAARAVWGVFSEAARQSHRVVDLYVDALLAGDEPEEAIAAWERFRGPHAGGVLTNGDFERELSHRGFGWRVAAPLGSSWTRDADVHWSGEHSLRIAFDGPEDVAFHHAAQRVPVRGGMRYRLTGRWRGDGITGFQGPYVEVVSGMGPAGKRSAFDGLTGSWDWTRFELEFDVPREQRMLEVRIRRDRQRGSRLAGQLWLDDLHLAPLEGEPHG